MTKEITLEDVIEFVRLYGYKYALILRKELDKTRKLTDAEIVEELERNDSLYKKLADM